MTRWSFLLLAVAGCAAPPSVAQPRPPVAAPVPVREAPAELKELRSRIRELTATSERLKREAHDALDRGRYDLAASLHRESLDAAARAERERASEQDFVKAAARRLMDDLDHEEIGVREVATRELITLGAGAADLRSMSGDLSAEGQRRLESVLRTLEERLFVRQWAAGATASSEYANSNWSAMQATGAPNTPDAGDRHTAWASRESDGDSEWLALTFDAAVEAVAVRIHETYNAGAIVKVELRGATGAWRTAWEGSAAAAPTPRWLEVPVTARGLVTKEVRLTLDSKAVAGWNEIDAVQLVGRDPGAPPR